MRASTALASRWPPAAGPISTAHRIRHMQEGIVAGRATAREGAYADPDLCGRASTANAGLSLSWPRCLLSRPLPADGPRSSGRRRGTARQHREHQPVIDREGCLCGADPALKHLDLPISVTGLTRPDQVWYHKPLEQLVYGAAELPGVGGHLQEAGELDGERLLVLRELRL